MKKFTEQDSDFMRQALALAANGQGRVSPNPPVGCVLVKNNRVVGRGWHDRLGDLHAEAMALRDAGGEARGATAYVTLSPCTTHGRQPPCSDALIQAGVAEVIVAACDPNPKNCSGIEVLNQAGIPARFGLLHEEAEYVARGFFKLVRTGLPYVTLKYAMTLDGKIAAASGDSRWVSGPESREMVQDMRSRHDAIMVGSGTALADNPMLNVREPVLSRRGGPGRHRQPVRVVIDGRARLPLDSALLTNTVEPAGRVLVVTADSADDERRVALRNAGAYVAIFPDDGGHVDLRLLLEELGRMEIGMLLCEGGGGLAAALLKKGLVDEIAAFVAPKIIGGSNAPGPVGGLGIGLMANALPLRVIETSRVGEDIFVRAVLTRQES